MNNYTVTFNRSGDSLPRYGHAYPTDEEYSHMEKLRDEFQEFRRLVG